MTYRILVQTKAEEIRFSSYSSRRATEEGRNKEQVSGDLYGIS